MKEHNRASIQVPELPGQRTVEKKSKGRYQAISLQGTNF